MTSITQLQALVATLRADNERITGERDRAIADATQLERSCDERAARINLMPLSRAATKIAGDYESCRRLCAKGIVPTAQRTADGRHWIVDVLEMQIAARHAGLIGAPSATFAGISRTWWPSFVSSRAQ